MDTGCTPDGHTLDGYRTHRLHGYRPDRYRIQGKVRWIQDTGQMATCLMNTGHTGHMDAGQMDTGHRPDAKPEPWNIMRCTSTELPALVFTLLVLLSSGVCTLSFSFERLIVSSACRTPCPIRNNIDRQFQCLPAQHENTGQN